MNPTNKNITITGSFTDDDMKELYEAVRKIERRRPDDVFTILSSDSSDKSPAELEEVMRKIFPRIEGDEPNIVNVKLPSGAVEALRQIAAIGNGPNEYSMDGDECMDSLLKCGKLAKGALEALGSQ